jgi:O-antigen/teichoic acid export membrane protein
VIAARQIIMQAKRYSKFPKLSMPGILAGSLSRELVSILIPAFYSLGALGAFSIARRVLGVPTAAIGSAMSQVYFQEACSERQKTGKVAKSFLSALRKLSLISSILFIPLFFAVEDIFVVFFGENWREAGVITGYMTPYFFIRFICAPLTVTLSAIERNDISLLANISLLASAVGTLFTSHLLSLDFSYFVILYSITMGLVHLFILIVIWILCR